MIRWLLALLIFSLLTTHSIAAQRVALCNEPKGYRYDYGVLGQRTQPRLEEGEAGFTGINPVFAWDDENPKFVTVIWGSAVVPGITKEEVERIVPTKVNKIPVIHRTTQAIFAIEKISTGVWVYAIYPKLNWITASRQTHWINGKLAIGSTFQMQCEIK